MKKAQAIATQGQANTRAFIQNPVGEFVKRTRKMGQAVGKAAFTARQKLAR